MRTKKNQKLSRIKLMDRPLTHLKDKNKRERYWEALPCLSPNSELRPSRWWIRCGFPADARFFLLPRLPKWPEILNEPCGLKATKLPTKTKQLSAGTGQRMRKEDRIQAIFPHLAALSGINGREMKQLSLYKTSSIQLSSVPTPSTYPRGFNSSPSTTQTCVQCIRNLSGVVFAAWHFLPNW